MAKPYTLNACLDSEVRVKLHHKSDLKAILFVLAQAFTYSACLVGAIADYSIFTNTVFSIYIGLVIGQFFIIGHDACHQSLAKKASLNKFIGRFCFSFALHSYTLWTLEHNQKHHGNTNIKGKDPSWTPMSKEEFEQKSKVRQWLERFYRSPFGAGAYYINEMWLKNHILPTRPDARSKWRKHLPDTFLVFIAFVVQLCIILCLGSLYAPNKSIGEILLLGWLIPFLSWNWLMGFVIYVHHTHPDIPWFPNSPNLPLNQVQTHVTAHVIFPTPVKTMLYNIMEHTAHHLQTSVPMSNLHLAQKQLEEAHSQNIVVYRWTLAEYMQITKVCKLYDFKRKCWMDFDGNPTSDSIPNLVYENSYVP